MAADQKITSLLQLYDAIPYDDRIIVDVLRTIVAEQLPAYKQIFYKIYNNVGVINENGLVKLLKEEAKLNKQWSLTAKLIENAPSIIICFLIV